LGWPVLAYADYRNRRAECNRQELLEGEGVSRVILLLGGALALASQHPAAPIELGSGHMADDLYPGPTGEIPSEDRAKAMAVGDARDVV
jgi:hypothetical protein